MISRSRPIKEVVDRGTTASTSPNTFQRTSIRAGTVEMERMAQGYSTVHNGQLSNRCLVEADGDDGKETNALMTPQ